MRIQVSCSDCSTHLLTLDIISAAIEVYTRNVLGLQEDPAKLRKLHTAGLRAYAVAMRGLCAVVPTSEHVEETKEKMIKIWRDYGEVIGIHQDTELEQMTGIQHGRVFFPKHCNWKLCLCSQSAMKPLHRIRVCKGCYCVYYCNSNCQARWVILLQRDSRPRLTIIKRQRLESGTFKIMSDLTQRRLGPRALLL